VRQFSYPQAQEYTLNCLAHCAAMAISLAIVLTNSSKVMRVPLATTYGGLGFAQNSGLLKPILAKLRNRECSASFDAAEGSFCCNTSTSEFRLYHCDNAVQEECCGSPVVFTRHMIAPKALRHWEHRNAAEISREAPDHKCPQQYCTYCEDCPDGFRGDCELPKQVSQAHTHEKYGLVLMQQRTADLHPRTTKSGWWLSIPWANISPCSI